MTARQIQKAPTVMGTCLEGDSGANSFPFEANLISPIPSMLHLKNANKT